MTESAALDYGPILGRTRPRIITMLVAMVVVATVLTYFGAARLFERQALARAENQLSLYLRSLNETLKQHQHLPYILAQNTDLQRAFAAGQVAQLNVLLRDFSNAAGLEAIYAMDLSGRVLAASNAGEKISFLGQNYGFRPYFREALSGARSDYFAIGATSGRPGYFVAEPLRGAAGETLGVIAIKLDISELQASWEAGDASVFATNRDGIVVIASDPGWLYRAAREVDAERRAELVQSRQFGTERLESLGLTERGPQRIALGGRSYFVAERAADWRGWRVSFLSPVSDAWRQTLLTTALMGTLFALLIGFATYLRSQRIAMALTVSQRHRKELIEANTALKSAQEELERSSKLAALGQLAASVTHELGQPISAFKTHLLAAEMGNEITSPETAGNLKRLADRMDAITGQLRFFARGGTENFEPVDLARVIREAVGMLAHDVKASGAALAMDLPKRPAMVRGHEVQLEQAAVNLLRNALHAVAGRDAPRIGLRLYRKGAWQVIEITDNGIGLDGMTLEKLQEPFFSTKPSGLGMGLGLSITAEILRAHGGHLQAEPRAGGGAVFSLHIRALSEGEP